MSRSVGTPALSRSVRGPYMFSTYRRGVGAQASQVEMGVAGLKRVERPGDPLDSLGAGDRGAGRA